MGKDIKESTKGRTIASKGSNTDEKVQNERKRANVDSSNQSVIKKKPKRVKIKKESSSNSHTPLKQSGAEEKSSAANDNSENITNTNDKQSKKARKDKERRQKKKDKRAKERQEQNHIHETKGQGKAIRYLDEWQLQHDGKDSLWKFEKCRQIWLIQNAYDETKVPDSKFDSLLQYMASIKGSMREMAKESARKKLELGENAKNLSLTIENPETESKENIPESTEKPAKRKSKKKKKKQETIKEDLLTEKALQRASDIIEMLKD